MSLQTMSNAPCGLINKCLVHLRLAASAPRSTLWHIVGFHLAGNLSKFKKTKTPNEEHSKLKPGRWLKSYFSLPEKFLDLLFLDLSQRHQKAVNCMEMMFEEKQQTNLCEELSKPNTATFNKSKHSTKNSDATELFWTSCPGRATSLAERRTPFWGGQEDVGGGFC